MARMRSASPEGSRQTVSGSGTPSPASRCSSDCAWCAVQMPPSDAMSGVSTGRRASGAKPPHSSSNPSAVPAWSPPAAVQCTGRRCSTSGYIPSGACEAASSSRERGRAVPSGPRSASPATAKPSAPELPPNASRRYRAGITSSSISTSKSPPCDWIWPAAIQSARLVETSTTTLEANPPVPQSSRRLPTGQVRRKSSSSRAGASAEAQNVSARPSSSAAATGAAWPFTRASGR